MNEAQLKQYANMVNDDRYSALLFASFKGSIPIIEMCLSIGADMHHVNSFGINVCHVAAQGDQPAVMYYWKQKGMDMRATDKRKSTPLHWAAWSKAEITL